MSKQQQHPTTGERLNLGCGPDFRDGWTNVDISDDLVPVPDLVYDLEETEWPLPDDHYRAVLVDNVLEHIEPRKRADFIDECHRVLRADGELILRLPVPESGVGWDVTHYGVPAWWLLEHPRHRDDWNILAYRASRIAIGRLLPERLARLLTRKTGLSCLDQVEVRARPLST